MTALVAGLASTAAVTALHATPAGAYVYWVNNASHSIGRANLDGTGVNQNFIPAKRGPADGSIAVDSTHIYWTYDTLPDSEDVIRRARLDGTGVERNFAPVPGEDPVGLAPSGTHVFYGMSSGVKAIRKSDGVAQNCITGIVGPYDVAASATHVYWANEPHRTIGRAAINCGAANEDWLDVKAPVGPGVAINSSHVFWTGASDGTVGRASIDGNPASVNTAFISGPDFAYDVDVNDSQVYWTSWPANTIGRANLSGAMVSSSFIHGDSRGGTGLLGPFPSGVAVDSLQPPASPETTIPELELSGEPRQTSRRRVEVEVSCNTACHVEVGATVKVPKVPGSSAAAAGKKRYDLTPASADVAAGHTEALTLDLPKNASKRVKRAFKKGKKSRVTVTATASDAAGNSSPASTLKVKLKR